MTQEGGVFKESIDSGGLVIVIEVADLAVVVNLG
jgi:hypothetical protein